MVSGAIIGWLVYTMGTGPFFAAARSLTPLTVMAALCAGTAATIVQAQRWRLVSRGFGMNLGISEAVAQCWQASFLNSVLPGGLAGDALRTVEQRRRVDGSWRGSLGSVGGERIVATVITLTAAAVVLLPRQLWLGAVVSGLTVVVAVIAWFFIRRLSWSSQVHVVALSCASWLIFVGLFAVAMLAVQPLDPAEASVPEVTAGEIVGLGALALAGMSVPISVGGWGPREGVAAFGFVLFGYSAEQGVAVAVSYGILALVSVLPGLVIMLVRIRPRHRDAR